MFYTEEIGLTYDDVLLVPSYSEVLPTAVDVKSKFSKNITMNIPIASSAMDTVTESATAIKMAQLGGIGVIHKNLSASAQAKEVTKVKSMSQVILDPITVKSNATLEEIKALVAKRRFSGFPVVADDNTLLGIITNRDIRYEADLTKIAKEIMTPIDNLVVVDQGANLDDAKKILHAHRIEKLPVIDKSGKLAGLITIKDIEKSITYPNSNKDSFGRLGLQLQSELEPRN